MTDLELQLLNCLREARRLANKTCRGVREVNAWHRQADQFLAMQPEFDDQDERLNAPHRVQHRKFVDSLFSPGRP